MMMMQMTFYWGKSVTLLFDSWTTSTWPAYLLTLLAIFLFSAFYLYLEDRRLKFKAVHASKPQIAASSIESPLLPQLVQHSKFTTRCIDAMLFGVNSALGYMLMLAVMSYNGGVFIAVVFGLLFGYLVFRSQEIDIMESQANPCPCAWSDGS